MGNNPTPELEKTGKGLGFSLKGTPCPYRPIITTRITTIDMTEREERARPKAEPNFELKSLFSRSVRIG